MRVIRLGVLVAAVGCGKEETGSIYEASNLEQATVEFQEELESGRRDLVGDLTVDGSGKSWTLRFGTESVSIYTPTNPDLTALDGLVGARAALALEPISEELSLQVTDADGVLQYLLEPVEPGPLTNEILGLGALAEANGLGTLQQGVYEVTLVSAWLRTDTGDIELLPGEPAQALIDGGNFRATLLSGFTSEINDDRALRCEGADSRLAFELIRLADGASADQTPLTRAQGSALPIGTCEDAPVLPE